MKHDDKRTSYRLKCLVSWQIIGGTGREEHTLMLYLNVGKVLTESGTCILVGMVFHVLGSLYIRDYFSFSGRGLGTWRLLLVQLLVTCLWMFLCYWNLSAKYSGAILFIYLYIMSARRNFRRSSSDASLPWGLRCVRDVSTFSPFLKEYTQALFSTTHSLILKECFQYWQNDDFNSSSAKCDLSRRAVNAYSLWQDLSVKSQHAKSDISSSYDTKYPGQQLSSGDFGGKAVDSVQILTLKELMGKITLDF